jgi:hypothetical protein
VTLLQRFWAAIDWLAEHHILTVSHSVLFLCASIYLGTGLSLGLFQFPSFSDLTVSNYHIIIVPPIDRATKFFTYMTQVMYLTGGLMLVAEWRTWMRLVPIVVLVSLTTTTMLTILVIFDYNRELSAGITDQARLDEVMASWMTLNWIRIAIWVVMWGALMVYFAVRAAPAIRARR